MTNTVLYIMAEHSLTSRTHRGSCRERLKDLTVINPVVNWAVILNSQGFYTTCLLRKDTHTHKPVSIKDGIRNELLKKK